METLLLTVVPLVGYLIAYHVYGKYLARKIFRLDDSRPVPSRELEDGTDYVPTRKGIIFGHHYTSIAGTGPIVGPAIGIIWGWVPALIWVFVGSIVMGAVHDFGSLVVSLRNEGKSLSDIAGPLINKRVRTIFFLIVFFELWIVIAIFGLIIGLLFARYPQSVFPIWMEIPIAVALGYAIYKRGASVYVATAIAVVAMYITVALGHWLQISLPQEVTLPLTGFTLPAVSVWIIILLVYAFIASTLPVTTLLQPRDFINGWQLFIAMGLLLMGAIAASTTAGLEIVAPAFNASPTGAPPLWPFLFVTIACGAISGFHCLVASGTTPKQVSKEGDALFVGYGSMLLEGALAVLVIVAVGAGIGMQYRVPGADPETFTVLTGRQAWAAHYASWAGASGLGSKLEAVVTGSANMMATFGVPFALGIIIMGVFIASFAGTTLDTATRIQRYVLAELGEDLRIRPLTNRFIATGIAIVTAAALAFVTGANGMGAMKLWPMFGAVNQLLASLALLIVTVYLRRRLKWGWLVTALPMVFMLVMTHYAMVLNELSFVNKGDWLLVVANALVQVLAVWMTIEAIIVFFRGSPAEAPSPVAAEA
jgi:carbon starvation protein